MTFKNDKERIAYLDAFKEFDKDEKSEYAEAWNLQWLDRQDGRRFLITEPAEDVCFIVEQAYQTIEWPKKHRMWCTKGWYIIDGDFSHEVDGIWCTEDGATFEDHAASRTMALAKLKDLQKEGRLK